MNFICYFLHLFSFNGEETRTAQDKSRAIGLELLTTFKSVQEIRT